MRVMSSQVGLIGLRVSWSCRKRFCEFMVVIEDKNAFIDVGGCGVLSNRFNYS